MTTIFWRVVKRRYATPKGERLVTPLDAGWWRLIAGRWHPQGVPIRYAAMSKAQALLEIQVVSETGASLVDIKSYLALPIIVPNPGPGKRLPLCKLPRDRRSNYRETQAIGKEWL